MKARKQLPSWLQAIWDEREKELRRNLRAEMYDEAVKQCNEIMSQNSSDCMNRCLNLIMMACKSIGLSPRTGQRIGKELDTYILPKWGFYAQTGDGDFAFAHELEEAGYPVFETNGKL